MARSTLLILLVLLAAACFGKETEQLAGGVSVDVVACPDMEPEVLAGMPADVIPLGALPEVFELPLLAYVEASGGGAEGEEVFGFALVDAAESGGVRLIVPFHPSGSPEGGPVRLLVTDGTITCAPMEFTVEALPPAPGEMAAVVEGLRAMLAIQAGWLDTTMGEIMAMPPGEVPVENVGLAVAQAVLDHPEYTDYTLASIVSGTSLLSEEVDLDLIDRLVASTGVRALIESALSSERLSAVPVMQPISFSTPSGGLTDPSLLTASSVISGAWPFFGQLVPDHGNCKQGHVGRDAAKLDNCMRRAERARFRLEEGAAGDVLRRFDATTAAASFVPVKAVSVAADVVGLIPFLLLTASEAAAGALPSQLTEMTLETKKTPPSHSLSTEFAEDEPATGSWTATLTATSTGWDGTARVAEFFSHVITNQLSLFAHIDNLPGLAKLEGYQRKVVELRAKLEAELWFSQDIAAGFEFARDSYFRSGQVSELLSRILPAKQAYLREYAVNRDRILSNLRFLTNRIEDVESLSDREAFYDFLGHLTDAGVLSYLFGDNGVFPLHGDDGLFNAGAFYVPPETVTVDLDESTPDGLVHAEIRQGDAVRLSSRHDYEPVRPGTATLSVRTGDRRFGGKQLSEVEGITVHPIEITISPGVYFPEPDEHVTFKVTVSEAFYPDQIDFQLQGPSAGSSPQGSIDQVFVVDSSLGVVGTNSTYTLVYTAPSQPDVTVGPDRLVVRHTSETGARAYAAQPKQATATILFRGELTVTAPPCIEPGGREQLTVAGPEGSNPDVIWTIATDGGTNRGRISRSGLYTAPNQATIERITATLRNNPSVSHTVAIVVGECSCRFRATIGGLADYAIMAVATELTDLPADFLVQGEADAFLAADGSSLLGLTFSGPWQGVRLDMRVDVSLPGRFDITTAGPQFIMSQDRPPVGATGEFWGEGFGSVYHIEGNVLEGGSSTELLNFQSGPIWLAPDLAPMSVFISEFTDEKVVGVVSGEIYNSEFDLDIRGAIRVEFEALLKPDFTDVSPCNPLFSGRQ